MTRRLGMAVPPSPAMIYGSAMHTAVAAMGCDDVTRGDASRIQSAFCDAFDKGRARSEAFGDSAEQHPEGLWAELRQNGILGLQSFYGRWVGADHALLDRTVLTEAPFEISLPEAGLGVSLSGIWDRVEDADGDARIIEFKSLTKHAATRLVKPAAPSATRLQLLLYALAFQRVYGVAPAQCIVEIIESGDRAVLEFDLTPDSADLREATEAVASVATAIRDRMFTPTPDFFACKTCPFRASCDAVKV